MKPDDLTHTKLTSEVLKGYEKRAPTVSAQFLRWFLENIFRLDAQDADDASVDGQQDKGVDGLYVNDTTETVHIIQVKTKQKKKATQGDTELKEFWGTLQQFRDPKFVEELPDGNAHEDLKRAVKRTRLASRIAAGYRVEGVFVTNVPLNQDGKDYLATLDDHFVVYDAKRIASEFVSIDANEGVEGLFEFDVSDTEVVSYDASDSVKSRIFLAKGLQLTHLAGIEDGRLFERNVRLSLGNTKINKSLLESIRNKVEHRNFPLYHNGITILCHSIKSESDQKLSIENYVVVNGAQSLTSLFKAKNSITDDLRILVKVVEVQGDHALADKITTYSNNQNAIKARDMRSNHNIQQRLKKEFEEIAGDDFIYEVKRGEKAAGREVLENDHAGLILLAMEVGEPWAAHQRYKIMDESHSKIFGRPNVSGAKIYGLWWMFDEIWEAVDEIDDETFANYTLTKFFLAYAVSEIFRSDPVGRRMFESFDKIIANDELDDLMEVVEEIAGTTADDLNAEYEGAREENSDFDYKAELKSPTWCRSTVAKLKSQHSKDVKRKKAKPISELLKPFSI